MIHFLEKFVDFFFAMDGSFFFFFHFLFNPEVGTAHQHFCNEITLLPVRTDQERTNHIT